MDFFTRIIRTPNVPAPMKSMLGAAFAGTAVPILIVDGIYYGIKGQMPSFAFSLIIPLLLTPVVLIVVVRLLTYFATCKSALEEEIEKNRRKDMLLFEQERFALMGEMLSNISHQWRQPLNAINLTLLSAKVAQASGRLDEAHLENAFETIEQNTHHLSNTIDDFRSFFKHKGPTKRLPLRQIVYELNGIVGPTLKAENIVMEINWNDDTIHRLEIATAISQVLMNLINNAKDAVGPLEAAEKQIRLYFEFQSENESLRITVTDNGTGIDPAIQTKIFDPYFTTKQLTGSGIGLYMSRQIVQKLFGGTIIVCSMPGETSFTVTLPLSDLCRDEA